VSHRIVTAPELAPPVGYAHAVVAAPGQLVHLGGQTSLGPDGTIHGETLVEQFDIAAGNLLAALAAAGGEPQDIVSMQIFCCDPAEYTARLEELGRVWRARFGSHYPALGLFGVTRLFDEPAQVELMATAVIPQER
jgi:enamine deaminase RidA (YjgF/YER057c/UK114 family)